MKSDSSPGEEQQDFSGAQPLMSALISGSNTASISSSTSSLKFPIRIKLNDIAAMQGIGEDHSTPSSKAAKVSTDEQINTINNGQVDDAVTPTALSPHRAHSNPITPPTALNQPVPLTKFTIFGNLFPEMQLKVWKHAAAIPRVIKVRAIIVYNAAYLGYRDYLTQSQYRLEFRTSSPVSALLNTCYDSRKTVRKTLTSTLNLDPNRRIRFNPTIDIILLWNARQAGCESLAYVSTPHVPFLDIRRAFPDIPKMFAEVQNLAFYLPTELLCWPHFGHFGWLVTQFSSVKLVIGISLASRELVPDYASDGSEVGLKSIWASEKTRAVELGMTVTEVDRFAVILARRLERWSDAMEFGSAPWTIPESVVGSVAKLNS